MGTLGTRPDFSRLLGQHPYLLAFVSVGGSNLYGYATEQSDYDLYGMHLVPTRDLLTLAEVPQTVFWPLPARCAASKCSSPSGCSGRFCRRWSHSPG